MTRERAAASEAGTARVRAALEASAHLKLLLAEHEAARIAAAAERLASVLAAGGKALLFGNGGSAADAQHIAAEWTGRLGRDRAALPAIALPTNSSEMTAIGNDYGFERVFARLIEAHGRRGDVAIGISTSGNSPNVLLALDTARAIGLATLALTGKGGGKLPGRADLVIVVPSDDTQRIQEAHIAILHAICEHAESVLFPQLGEA